jgi:anti-sigma B factor antagonist
MDLRVSEHSSPGITVLELEGEVDLSTLPVLRDRLLRAATQQPGVVAVDIDAVAAMDDTGLGVLMGVAGRLRAHGGDLVLVCANPRLLELVHLTRLDRAIRVHPTRAAAIAAAHATVTPS